MSFFKQSYKCFILSFRSGNERAIFTDIDFWLNYALSFIWASFSNT